MRCQVCESVRTKVVDTRPTDSGDVVVRVRECKACKSRWRTLERFDHLIRDQGEDLRAENLREGIVRSNLGWPRRDERFLLRRWELWTGDAEEFDARAAEVLGRPVKDVCAQRIRMKLTKEQK